MKQRIIMLGLLAAYSAAADDHLDSFNAQARPMADIASLYAWTASDGAHVNFVLTVSPNDLPTRHFFPDTVYVIHVNSVTGVNTTGPETKIICKFESDTKHECWVGTSEVVRGDASVPAGITSTDGKVRLFVGSRSDPAAFNVHGLRAATATYKNAAPSLTVDTAGCPQLPASTSATLIAQLKEVPTAADGTCPAGAADCFAAANVKAIVLQVDSSLLNSGSNKVLAVWASTHAAT